MLASFLGQCVSGLCTLLFRLCRGSAALSVRAGQRICQDPQPHVFLLHVLFFLKQPFENAKIILNMGHTAGCSWLTPVLGKKLYL